MNTQSNKKPVVTSAVTREQARQFCRKAKKLGVSGLGQPVKSGSGNAWQVFWNRPTLRLNKRSYNQSI